MVDRERTAGHRNRSPRVQDDTEQKLAQVEVQMERLIELSLSQTDPLAAKKFEQKAQERERERLQAQIATTAVEGVAQRRRAGDIAALRRRLSDLPRIWQAATEAERNQMLRLAIERIEVTGEGRPKKLKISWADWLQ
ncbi:MAG: hypothetical protein ABR613_01710 [Actinomycetota bacterium]